MPEILARIALRTYYLSNLEYSRTDQLLVMVMEKSFVRASLAITAMELSAPDVEELQTSGLQE